MKSAICVIDYHSKFTTAATFLGSRLKPILCTPGARLVDMVVTPHALVEAGGKLRLHAVYYITKQIIPALERVLNLVGADPRSWFVGMTKPQRLLPQKRPPTALPLTDLAKPGGGIGTIDQYYLSRHCAVGFGPFQKLYILQLRYSLYQQFLSSLLSCLQCI